MNGCRLYDGNIANSVTFKWRNDRATHINIWWFGFGFICHFHTNKWGWVRIFEWPNGILLTNDSRNKILLSFEQFTISERSEMNILYGFSFWFVKWDFLKIAQLYFTLLSSRSWYNKLSICRHFQSKWDKKWNLNRSNSVLSRLFVVLEALLSSITIKYAMHTQFVCKIGEKSQKIHSKIGCLCCQPTK